MPSIDYQTLREEVPISRVLELLNFEPTTAGEQLRGSCPIHGSTSKGSKVFSVNLEKNAFQCFKCGEQGNQLDLWAAAHELSLYEASLLLCEKLGIELPRKIKH